MGQWGRCDTVKALGTPRCSCIRMRSVSPDDFAEWTRSAKTIFPLFKRILVGSISLISFANLASLDEGSRDVVIMIRASVIPERCAYPSSRAISSLVDLPAILSSYL